MRHRVLASLLVLAAAASVGRGHFIWVVPDKGAATAQVIFSATFSTPEPDLLAKVARTQWYARANSGRTPGPLGLARPPRREEDRQARGQGIQGGPVLRYPRGPDAVAAAQSSHPKMTSSLVGRVGNPSAPTWTGYQPVLRDYCGMTSK